MAGDVAAKACEGPAFLSPGRIRTKVSVYPIGSAALANPVRLGAGRPRYKAQLPDYGLNRRRRWLLKEAVFAGLSCSSRLKKAAWIISLSWTSAVPVNPLAWNRRSVP